MATHSSVLAWRIPGTGGAWWAAVYGVAQNRTWLKRLSSSSSRSSLTKELSFKFYFIITNLNLNSHTISQLHFKKISNISPLKQISVQCSYSVLSDSLRPHELQHTQASLSITNSQSSLKIMSIESVMPSSHLILSSPSPPAFNVAQHQAFFQWGNSSH